MIKIYYLPITSTIEHTTWQLLLSKTSLQKQERVNSLRFDIDKKLSLFAHLLVRTFASETLSLPNSRLDFSTHEYGKPYLADHPNFHFSISHTRNAIAVAIHSEPIGIDIERMNKQNMKIAHRFFTVNETNYIKASDHAKRFYEVWTKKEAFIKWQGKGLSIPLRHFDVLENNAVDLFDYRLIDDYALSICGDLAGYAIQFQQLTEDDLIMAALLLDNISN